MIKVAITGKIRSGKDTLGKFFIEKGATEFKFGDGIGRIIREYFPEVVIHGKPRRHYQIIGQSLRELNPDVWVNYTLGKVSKMEIMYPEQAQYGVVITDLRQYNEYLVLKSKGYTIIKVECPYEDRVRRMQDKGDSFTPEDLEHPTETGIDLIPADYVIHNGGSKKDLYIQFIELYSKLSQ